MNKLNLVLSLMLLSISMNSFAARESKCVVKLKYKVERQDNKQYLWCLDDWEEDGQNYFYTTRRYVTRGVSEQECNEIANDSIGLQSTLQFVAAPPMGMVLLVDLDQDPYQCDGTVVEISKIKYKKAKY